MQAKKLESLMKKQQLVYAMLDTTLDLELLTDALRAVLKANGAPCSLLGDFFWLADPHMACNMHTSDSHVQFCTFVLERNG